MKACFGPPLSLEAGEKQKSSMYSLFRNPLSFILNEIEPYFGNFQRKTVIATLIYMVSLWSGCFIGKIPPTDLSVSLSAGDVGYFTRNQIT